MLIPILAVIASTSSLFLARDTYQHFQYFSENKDMHRVPSATKIDSSTTALANNNENRTSTTTSTRSSSSSTADAAARLSALEHQGVKKAKQRSIRILALIGVILVCSLAITDARSAATSLYAAFEATPSITTAGGIATLCQNAIKASASNTFGTVSLLFSLYLLLQTFCIPGTIALNAVLGALLGTPIAAASCVVLGTIGACCCFTLSSAVGTDFATWLDKKLLDGKGISQLRSQVNKYRSDLLSYLLFLRLTPVLPNWLINIASPVLGVPLQKFALATFLGIAPQTYLSVRFGAAAKTLSEKMLKEEGGEGGGGAKIVTIYDTFLIALIGVMVIVVNRLKSRFAGKNENENYQK